jgi:DNA-directed RNA polymerase specialized sigma24 family protein
MSTAQPDFDLIHRQHRPVVLAAIRRTLPWVSPQDAEDVEQDVWCRIWKTFQPESRARFDPSRSRLTTFLFLVTKSVALNWLAKHQHDPTHAAVSVESRTSFNHLVQPSPQRALVAADLLARFRAAAAAAEDGAELLAYYDAHLNGTRLPRGTVPERARALLAKISGVA